MRRRGYQLTRYADDWAVTCRSRREAEAALRCARKILTTLGVQLNVRKTRIVHVRRGVAFLGYTIKRGQRALYLPAAKITSKARRGGLYAYPTQKSIDRFKDAVRRKTQRRIPLQTGELIRDLNPVIRGWGEYYKRAHVRRLNQLDRWVVRRVVASLSTVALCGVEDPSDSVSLWRAGAGEPDRPDPFVGAAARSRVFVK